VKLRTSLLVLGCVAVIALTVAVATVDEWLFELLDPGAFVASHTPAEPDYTEASSWAALPTTEDDADVFLADYPAIDSAAAPADVFFVHPTTWVGSEWNGPIDDPVVIEATARGATLIQASAFNACCAVYAPRYRQAGGRAFTKPNASGARAIDVAFRDVSAAFDSFLERRGRDRPFILASHSQGTVLAARLLRESIARRPIGRTLVAAYLIGGPISRETIGAGVPVCETATQTGCVVGWNARGPRYVVNALEFTAPDVRDTAAFLARRICVNPLTWRTDGAHAPASANAAAVFFDAEEPRLLVGFADAKCENGQLTISEIGNAPRDFMSRILDWMMGPENYHPIEYQLFYLNLRNNALDRVAAFVSASEKMGAKPTL
jgi:hypothetical protein